MYVVHIIFVFMLKFNKFSVNPKGILLMYFW